MKRDNMRKHGKKKNIEKLIENSVSSFIKLHRSHKVKVPEVWQPGVWKVRPKLCTLNVNAAKGFHNDAADMQHCQLMWNVKMKDSVRLQDYH